MTKLIATFLLATILASTAVAQPKIEKSELIEAPGQAYLKVVMMRNGKTCYVQYNGDGGIALSIYNGDRKLASKTKISSGRWDGNTTKNTTVLGTYDINGELVVFLQQQDKKHPVLYRLRINTDDGKLLKEDVLATTKKGNGFMAKDRVNTQLFVVKDKQSDCYAVIFFDNLDENADDALKILHFDSKHTLLSTGRMTAPDKNIRNIVYLDGVVNGDKNVFFSTYFTGSGDESSKIYVSRLDAGQTTIATKALDFSEDFMNSNASMTYNSVSKKIQMIIATFEKTKRSQNIYLSLIAYIDPATLDISAIKPNENDKISSFARNNLAYEKDYPGLPQASFVNSHGETIILKQAMAYTVVSSSKGGSYIQSTTLGDIGVSHLAPDGHETESYLVPHVSLAGGEIHMMYLDDIQNGAWQNLFGDRHYGTSDQDYTFRYVCGQKADYVIFNDYLKNLDNPNNERLKQKDKLNSQLNASYTIMKNGNISRALLFEKPTDKKSQQEIFMSAADQDDNGHLATIMYSATAKSEEYRLIWLSFE